MTDPATIAALVERLRRVHLTQTCGAKRSSIWSKSADTIESLQAGITTAREEGFAAGVEAATKVAEE